LIGGSDFFELAVAVTLTLFGAQSGAAWATLVGLLVEVPVMVSFCTVSNQSRNLFRREETSA
jgi:ACR3 family arsenite transporter